MATSNLRSSMRTIMCSILCGMEHPEVTLESSEDEIQEVENPVAPHVEHPEVTLESNNNGIENVENAMAHINRDSTYLQASRALTPKICRICYNEEDASKPDPIISVGCRCTGDISYGHKSCLIEWFRARLCNTLEVTCEVCKGPLERTIHATLLETHIKSFPVEDAAPGEVILLQVPIEDLDRLQVPIDTPAFDTLDRHTQKAIDEILYEQYEKHEAEVKARGRTVLEMVARGPDRPTQIAHVRRGWEVLQEYIEMVIVQQPNPPYRCAFFPRNGDPPNIKLGMYTNLEDVLRVRATPHHEDVVNALSRELAFSVFLLIDMSRTEQLILLPRLMVVDAVYTDRAPGALFPPLSPVEGASSERQVTYGIYQFFPLCE